MSTISCVWVLGLMKEGLLAIKPECVCVCADLGETTAKEGDETSKGQVCVNEVFCMFAGVNERSRMCERRNHVERVGLVVDKVVDEVNRTETPNLVRWYPNVDDADIVRRVDSGIHNAHSVQQQMTQGRFSGDEEMGWVTMAHSPQASYIWMPGDLELEVRPRKWHSTDAKWLQTARNTTQRRAAQKRPLAKTRSRGVLQILLQGIYFNMRVLDSDSDSSRTIYRPVTTIEYNMVPLQVYSYISVGQSYRSYKPLFVYSELTGLGSNSNILHHGTFQQAVGIIVADRSQTLCEGWEFSIDAEGPNREKLVLFWDI
ncbi:hypothetical protein C8R44DRAFT_728372 [Mycena epipterygia]|nr:hypothetical protein C8R44DRAFT_728372 [Mycena epipterygia]